MGWGREETVERIRDRYWSKDRLGGPLRSEVHYDGRSMLCYSERPPTVEAMFADNVRRFPDRPAIIEDRTLSYRELDGLVGAIAAGLAAHGVAAGGRVAFLLGNGWEFLALTLASARIGAIAVPIGIRQPRAEVEFLLNDCGATVLVFEASLAAAVPEPGAVPSLRHRFAANGDDAAGRPFADLYEGRAGAVPAAVAEEDTAVILYTSGTTGRPKGARLTHLGIVHSALTFARCYGLDEHDRGLVAVPMSHVTGLVGVTLSTMAVGGAVVAMRRPYKTPEFLALAARERITYSILVPAIYTLCAMHEELTAHDLSAWRIGCFGGAPMPVATIELLAAKLPHLLLLNAYGATETTSPTTIMPRTCWREHMDSVGQLVPCAEVKVLDEEGAEVAPGALGELWISGPMVVPGYWARPEANASEFVDGFWRSGDIGSIDADGFVRLFDRRKDMINRGGFKVFSAEVENVLCSLEGVVECAIVGSPDPVLGERVHAFVVPKAGAALTVDAVRRHCTERLSDYKVPERIVLLAEPLPKNANGKVQKAELRAMIG